MKPMSQTPDVVERVEGASLSEMRNVDIDDVYVQMDWVLQQRATPMDLYHRWEKQNWSTQDLDFAEDKQHWSDMTGVFEGFRTELQRTFTLFFIGEQAVTDTLSPLVHAAPDEPSRIFLSTQIVDEARHSVFFSRFFEQVVGVSGGLTAALDQIQRKLVPRRSGEIVEMSCFSGLPPYRYSGVVDDSLTLLVDAPSLYFRAFFSTPPSVTTPDKQPIKEL